MTYVDELNRKYADFTAEDCKLRSMEVDARLGKQTSKLFNRKWFTVFTRPEDRTTVIYRWEGGYPTQYIGRKAALAVLATA